MKKFISLILCIMLPLSGILCRDMKAVSKSAGSYANITAFENGELKDAIKRGFVPKEMRNKYNSQVTGKELVTLLKIVVALKKGNNKTWSLNKEVAIYNNCKSIERQYAAVIIYHAAKQGLSISTPNGCLPTYSNYYSFKDEVDHKYGKLEATYQEAAFPFSQYDLTTDVQLMQATKDGYARFGSKMTRLEAIEAAYRLSNSITPKVNYVSMNKVGTMSLTKSERAVAKRLPTPKVSKLPAWHGLTLTSGADDDKFEYGTKYYCENDVKILSQLGFNFARVQLNFYNLFKSEKLPVIDDGKLKNLDDLVRWGIKYRVHICFAFMCLPGYQSESYAHGKSGKDDFFSNSGRQIFAVKIWTMMAKHYKDVPSSALSFNLLNEPMSEPQEQEETVYEGVAEKMIAAIKAEDASRFIFADGIRNNLGGPARKPAESLRSAGVAQAMHFYCDELSFANNAFNEDAYSPQGWPLPFVDGETKNGGNPLTVTGNFEANTKITVHINGIGGFGDIRISADGKQIAGKSILKHKVGVNGCTGLWDSQGSGGDYDLTLNATLPEKTEKIEISYQGTDKTDWYKACVDSVILTYPELSKTPVPFYGAALKDDGGTIIYRKNKVTNIVCSTDSDYRLADSFGASTVKVNSSGIYSDPEQADKMWDINYMRGQIADWTAFSKKYGVAVMCQEFGDTYRMRSEVGNAFLNDWLTVLDENNIPWCMYSFWGAYGIFTSKQADAKVVKYGPYYLNEDKLAVLKKHMKQ